MDQEKITGDLISFLVHASKTFGTGHLAVDIVIVSAFFCCIAFFLALYAWMQVSKSRREHNTGELRSLPGRVAKMEHNLNDFRTEIMRSIEAFRNDAGFIKKELDDISQAIKGKKTGGSSGSGGSGGGSIWQDEVADEIVPDDEQEEPSETDIEESLDSKLSKSSRGLFGRIRSLFKGREPVGQDMLDEVEAILVGSDLGVKLSASLIEKVKSDQDMDRGIEQNEFVTHLKKALLDVLSGSASDDLNWQKQENGPTVVMVVGVNGVGKTTTAAKLAERAKRDGLKVLLVAADTFRAAAVEQLCEWGKRIEVEVVSGQENAKPSTVVFDAMKKAIDGKFDLVLIDTAGRLHTKSSLMQELTGIRNAISRHQEGAPHETLLVLDGTTGQNALFQAKEFNSAASITGLIMTKLDGTAKGGIVVAVHEELGVPVRFIGVGEGVRDLRPFSPKQFVDALFSDRSNKSLEKSSKVSAHAEARRSKRNEASITLN